MTLKNARHERFAQLLTEGRSQADAFKELYPKSRRWQADSVHEKASKLAAKVRPRLAELQAEIAKRVCIDKAEVVNLLAAVLRTPIGEVTAKSPLCQRWQAKPDGTVLVEMPSKIAAAAEIAKLLGWYEPERQEQVHRIPPDIETLELLRGAVRK